PPARAVATDRANVVLFDLALDYAKCPRLALAHADGCSDAAWSHAAGAIEAAGIAVSRIDEGGGAVRCAPPRDAGERGRRRRRAGDRLGRGRRRRDAERRQLSARPAGVG